ncbi:TonB-linked outer membrane protein, SusC/RagA family [Hymenobacter mucosus]|uniref:TonB-linked outer membrane protein, SusC/RagA family n=2 Tax=Hymenobacter mucosus TaxID=1411120 RepID=A0A239AHM3_9BACT|nr:TonB-linked outer membrane protein, SusC/RagA family [Hymenobacter mucosus]
MARRALVPLTWCASVGTVLGAVGPLSLRAETSATALQQAEIEILGAVTDTKGEPLPGVNVVLKGTSKGTVTDEQGRFRILVPDANAILAISFVGFKKQEVIATPGARMAIKLEVEDTSLGGVVVVGYGTQSRATVTGAVGQITNEELVRTPAVAATSALVGRIPGLTARQGDARPGSGTSIQIRNMGSPLYVIDGIQSEEGQFNNLGLSDIESISVLKDASAAIYGMRASNGVILVTTKRGKLGKPVVNINGYYGQQNFTQYPHPANAYQHQRGLVEAEQNRAQVERRAPNPVVDPVKGTVLTAEELEKWRTASDPAYKSYDYYDMVFRPNVPQYYVNGNVSGATDNMSYYLSGSYLDQKALIEDNYFKRYNIQANLEAKVTPRLRLGTQLYGRTEFRHTAGVPGLDDYFNPFLSVFSMWPTESPYANDNPNYVNQTHNINVNPATYKESITGYNDDDWRAGKMNLYGQYDFDFGLSVRATGSYNYTTNTFNGFEYTYNGYRYNPTTQTYDLVPGGGNQNPWREQRRRAIIERSGQIQLTYVKQLGDHGLTATAAYERYDTDNRFNIVHTVPPNNTIPIQYFANQDYLYDEVSEVARAGYAGRVGYNYKQKYLLELLGRYDGSWLFAPDSRFGLFPAVTAGYRITEEPFIKNNAIGNILTELKLRGSYGITGSDPSGLAPYSYQQGYDFGSGASVFNGNYTIGVRPRGLPITTLSWVRNKTTNLGLDFGLWGGKLSGAFDVFARRREGLPAPRYDVLIPLEVGYGLPNENLNSDVTRGLEGVLTYAGTASPGFTYSVSGHATIARRFDLDIYKQRFGNSWERYRSSYINRWGDIGWGYQAIGQFQSQQEIADYTVDNDGQGNRTQLPGDIIYKDVNGDGVINYLDERPIGYLQGGNPLVTFGVNTSLGYKNFTLTFDIVGAGMQTYQREWELLIPFQNNGTSPAYMLEDRWHRADPYNADSPWVPGKYPAIRRDAGGQANYNRRSDFWIKTVRYVRLRNLELAYSLPKPWLGKVGLSGVRVYMNATNLLTFSTLNDIDIDPEVAASNGLGYPPQRLLNTGLSVTF